MITIQRQAAQGDILLSRVTSLPTSNLIEAPPVAGQLILARSSTAHHHVVVGEARLYREDDLTSYLVAEEEVEVVHLRPHDTHETLRLGAGVWEVRRQREWVPAGWRRVED
jgi:hypothetical protein